MTKLILKLFLIKFSLLIFFITVQTSNQWSCSSILLVESWLKELFSKLDHENCIFCEPLHHHHHHYNYFPVRYTCWPSMRGLHKAIDSINHEGFEIINFELEL